MVVSDKTRRIQLAKEFSRAPFGRTPKDGPHSGQVFRDRHLVPALEKHEHVEVWLDGVAMLGTSFLEEAFAGLVRSGSFTEDELRRKLEIKFERQNGELQDYVRRAWKYVSEEERRQRG